MSRNEIFQPIREISDVFVHSKKLLPVGFANHPREPRIDRIDVNDVGHVQNGVGIVVDTIRLDRIAFVVDVEIFWTGITQMHPYRSRSGAAVK